MTLTKRERNGHQGENREAMWRRWKRRKTLPRSIQSRQRTKEGAKDKPGEVEETGVADVEIEDRQNVSAAMGSICCGTALSGNGSVIKIGRMLNHHRSRETPDLASYAQE